MSASAHALKPRIAAQPTYDELMRTRRLLIEMTALAAEESDAIASTGRTGSPQLLAARLRQRLDRVVMHARKSGMVTDAEIGLARRAIRAEGR